jgi:PAS domain-containing protein
VAVRGEIREAGIDSLSDAIILVDRIGHTVYANPATASVLGWALTNGSAGPSPQSFLSASGRITNPNSAGSC